MNNKMGDSNSQSLTDFDFEKELSALVAKKVIPQKVAEKLTYKLKEKANIVGVAAVRKILKQRLAWLEGYPITLFNSETISWSNDYFNTTKISRDILSQSTYALNKLKGDFPKAFPKVVKNHKQWLEKAYIKLEQCKNQIHSNETLPCNLFLLSQFNNSNIEIL